MANKSLPDPIETGVGELKRRTRMNKIYYLAYGSNLHPLRLMQRVPSATLIGTVKLTETRIVFHKRSIDGSGKCMILKDEIDKPIAYGALFSFILKEELLLDKAEGNGKGYYKQFVKCPVGEDAYSAFTYVAVSEAIDPSLRPYHWYKEFVLAGARYHQFPDEYIFRLEALESVQDPDEQRRINNEEILEKLSNF